MKARLLSVLDINDREVDTFVSGKRDASHFKVDKITLWKEAQEVLAGLRRVLPPDLLLLDVSFDKDDDVKGAALDLPNESEDPIVPIGPLLALPFLNTKTVMGFSPYSVHIENPTLKKHPPFLIAMGLIAAKIKGGTFGSTHLSEEERDNKLDTFISDLKGASDPIGALKIALELYRNNLLKAIQNKRLLLINSKQIIDAVEEWQENIEKSADGLEEIEVSSELGLEVIDEEGNPDSISLVSLFADHLSWVGRWAGEKAVDEINKWINKAAKSDSPFAKAISAIEEQNKVEESGGERPRIDDKIADLYPHSSEEERREIFRLCVLFANVHSLSLHKGQRYVKREIFGRLGVGVEQNIYLSWFGKRNRKSETSPSTNLLPKLNITPLTPINSSLAVTEINCFFLSNGTVLSEADDYLIKSYRRRYSDPDNPYSDVRFENRWQHPYSVK